MFAATGSSTAARNLPLLQTRFAYAGLGVIAMLTVLAYLVFGLYYVTKNSDRLGASITLDSRGEAYLASFPTWNTDEEGDHAFYNRLALGVLKTGLPRNYAGRVSIYAPVYTYFLAASYGLGGFNIWSLAVPQALLAGLLAWILGIAAGRLATQHKPLVMWLGGGLVLVNLRFATATTVIAPTLLLLPLFALALCILSNNQSCRALVAFAALIVIAVFTQSAFFVVAFGIALWLGWEFIRSRQAKWAIACAIVMAGVAGIVGIRAVVATMGDSYKRENKIMLWESNNPYYESLSFTGSWGRRPGNPWSSWQPSPAETERYQEYLKRGQLQHTDPGLLWIKENPGQYLKLCWIRLYTTLGPFTGQMSPRNRLISTFYWLLVFPAGYYGLWRTRHLPLTRMVAFIFIALTAFESLVITEWYLRYRMPWEIVLTLYAAVGYVLLFSKKEERLSQPAPALHQD